MNKFNFITSKVAPAIVLASAIVFTAGCGGSNRKTDAMAASSQPITDFEAAVDRPPTAATLYRMARLLSAQERNIEAEAVLLGMTRRFPDFLPAYTELSSVYIRQRQFDAAEEILAKGLEMSPGDAVMYNDLGMCSMLQQDYEGALEQFRNADAAAPKNARFRGNMALALGMLGRYDESLTVYRSIISEGRSHFNLAVICEARDDMTRAEEEFAAASLLGVKRES